MGLLSKARDANTRTFTARSIKLQNQALWSSLHSNLQAFQITGKSTDLQVLPHAFEEQYLGTWILSLVGTGYSTTWFGVSAVPAVSIATPGY